MFAVLQAIRDKVAGYKTYIVAAIGVLTALVAWGSGELTDVQFIGAIWVALEIVLVRAGHKRDSGKALDDAYNLGFTDAESIVKGGAYRDGYVDGCDHGEDDGQYEDEG